MVIELSEVKAVRKRLCLTQAGLASRSGVSQSLIAKIEAGRIDPTYSKARKIINALEGIRKKHEFKAEQVMHSSLISVKPETPIKEAIAKMKKHNISQMPVTKDQKCVGMVSESTILNSLLDRKAASVGKIMEDAPPVVSKNTSINVVSEILRHLPMVLVSDNGKLRGTITKFDILGKLKDYSRI